ncbi:MAG TPA: 16S rRNA (guanine(527)-N(7))-methyltransferase RsmG [Puia sp.]|nr:16S rRNA (guanine(527)-N(7))-methyltransferase RsmG [Puia sp.]
MEIIQHFFADFTPAQIEQLTALNALYREWNEKINVISRKDIDSLYEKHVLHSLAIAAAFTLNPGMDVIDIGTGGGFPGIPLAIFFPATRFHLVDSIGKKLKVVDAIREAIGLTNVSTRHIRAEEIKDRKFDLAVSRAVAPLKDLWAWSRPLLRKSDGRKPDAHPSQTGARGPAGEDADGPTGAPSGLICLKGGDLTEEIAASNTRPRIMEVHELFSREEFRQKYILQVPY